MKLTIFRVPRQPNYLLSIAFSKEHGMTCHARLGNSSFLECHAHDVTLTELEAMHKQLGEEIAKAIQER